MSHESFDAAVASHRYARIRTHYPDVDLFLLLTRHDADCFEREGFNNVGVMHNPLSFYPEQTSDLDGKVIVAAGRYAPEKGYDRLIDAFAAVAPDHPDWSLRIFGHGPMHAELQEQVRRLGLEGQVSCPGWRRTSRPSSRRARSSPCPRSMRGCRWRWPRRWPAGCRASRSTAQPGCARSSPTARTASWCSPATCPPSSAALRTLMDDDDLRHRLGAAARHSVRRFTPDAIAAEWEDVFALVER